MLEIGTPHGAKVRVAATIDAELYDWYEERLESDRSIRTMSHAIELGMALLREDLEAKDKAAKKRKR